MTTMIIIIIIITPPPPPLVHDEWFTRQHHVNHSHNARGAHTTAADGWARKYRRWRRGAAGEVTQRGKRDTLHPPTVLVQLTFAAPSSPTAFHPPTRPPTTAYIDRAVAIARETHTHHRRPTLFGRLCCRVGAKQDDDAEEAAATAVMRLRFPGARARSQNRHVWHGCAACTERCAKGEYYVIVRPAGGDVLIFLSGENVRRSHGTVTRGGFENKKI